jgi:hypothetical protein
MKERARERVLKSLMEHKKSEPSFLISPIILYIDGRGMDGIASRSQYIK